MVTKILTVPHPVLLKKAKHVNKINEQVEKIVKNMEDTLLTQRDPMGVGLSGNQIGVLKRIFVMRPDEGTPIKTLINPVIKKTVKGSKNRKPTLEGCLSIPQVWGHVLRPEKVTIEYQDLKGKKKTETFTGFAAVVAQHEMDHLNGVLFTQRVLEQGYRLFKETEGELQPYAF